MCAISDTPATDAHAYFLPMAYAIAKHNALIRVRFPVSDPLYLQIESCFFGAFWDMPLQLLAFLDAAERSCEISGEQHDSFAIQLKEELASARCTADKPERDRNGMIKWKKSLTFACATLADEIESRARAFFNCVPLTGGPSDRTREPSGCAASDSASARRGQNVTKKTSTASLCA